MTRSIGLLGDVMLGRGVADRLAAGAPEEVWAPELIELTSSLELLVCNLECAVSDGGRPTDLVKSSSHPFFFRSPPQAVVSLQAIGVDAVGVANNHALDFGADALSDTIRHLQDVGIGVAGAGLGSEEARRGIAVSGPNLRVGLIAVSDHPPEFAAAPGRFGTSYAALWKGVPAWLIDEIRRLGEACDRVLCFPHWGPNMTIRPAPWQRRVAAGMLSAGADLVAGHSAHVFHGVEQTEHGLVAYDLGDALDDYAVDPVLRNDLGVLALWHVGEEEASLELVGLALDYCHTRLATGAEADWIASRLEHACVELGTSVERVDEGRFRVVGSRDG